MAPVQLPTVNPAEAVAHAVVQSAGLLTVMEVLQAPIVAVSVTLPAIGMLIMLLPLTVPAVVVTVAPAVALKLTL